MIFSRSKLRTGLRLYSYSDFYYIYYNVILNCLRNEKINQEKFYQIRLFSFDSGIYDTIIGLYPMV